MTAQASFRKVSDLPMSVSLSSAHTMTSVRFCANPRQVLGIQTSYGVWNLDSVSDEVQMYPIGLTLDRHSWDDNRVLLERHIVSDALSANELAAFEPVW